MVPALSRRERGDSRPLRRSRRTREIAGRRFRSGRLPAQATGLVVLNDFRFELFLGHVKRANTASRQAAYSRSMSNSGISKNSPRDVNPPQVTSE